MRGRRWTLGAAALALACSDTSVVGTGGESSSSGSDGSGPGPTTIADTTTASSAETDAASSDGPTTSDTTSGPPAGCGNGTVEGLEHCDGGDDCSARCTLPSGSEIWRTELDNGDDDVFNDLAVTDGGEILALGARRSRTGWDSWIARFDATGALVDELTLDLGEGDDDRAQAIAAFGLGYVVVGFASQPSVEDEEDALVVALDGDLATLWSQRIDRGLDDSAFAVAVAPDAIAVGGTSEEPGNYLDGWFAVYDGSGELQWEQAIDGPASRNDEVRGLAWLDDGALAVVGNQYANDDTDLWITVREPGGAARWSERLDFEFGDDAAMSVRAVEDGILVAGSISSALTNSEEVWIARFAPDGTPGAVISYNTNGFVFDGAEDALASGEHVFATGVTSRPEEQRNALVGRWPAAGTGGRPPTPPDWTDAFDGGPGLADAGHALALLGDGSVVAVGEVTVLGQGTNAWIGRWAP